MDGALPPSTRPPPAVAAPSLPPLTGPMFNRAPLVQALTALQVADVALARQHLGERCSAWLAWTDDIALAGVLNGPAPQAPAGRPAAVAGQASAHPSPDPSLWRDAARRLRAELARAIDTDPQFNPAPGPRPGPQQPPRMPEPEPEPDPRADFAPWRQRCSAHQRSMDSRIAALRAPLRAAVAAQSPALARLAALDAVLEQALAERQRHLLGTVPGWLEKHCRSASPPPAALGRQVKVVLQAELDTRLLPLHGLIDALDGAINPAINPAGGLARPPAVPAP